MIRRPRSIRFRVLAVAVLLVGVGMLVVNLMALLTLRANLMAKVDQQLLAVPGEAFGPLLCVPLPPSTLNPPSAAPNSGFLNNQVGGVFSELPGHTVWGTSRGVPTGKRGSAHSR